ncbi:MAG TPA: hypothetical protein VK074_11760, partial [Fodinibius sp.]|nr:hypothetical protein [Fodinibius sp.]
MKQPPTHILKFGGTSLQSAAFVEQAARVVIDRARTARPFVVVSALEGVTDALMALADNPRGAGQQIDRLEQKHRSLFDRLVNTDSRHKQQLHTLFEELRQTIGNEALQTDNRQAWKDRILSVGERASARIFAAVLT